MDTDTVELQTAEEGLTRFRLLWEEILWDGNNAWYLVTVPSEASKGPDPEVEAEALELKSRLEQSMEMAASEVEKRQQVENDRQRLEAKLRDLHQRSVSKLEAARAALENEKSERSALLDRLTRLKEETDKLRAELEEKNLQAQEATHVSSEQFETLQADLDAKEKALVAAEERSERYRRVYEELDQEMMKSQEQSALLSAKLSTAEARLERYQRLLDGDEMESSQPAESQDQSELVSRLRERVAELEKELELAQSQPAPEAPDVVDQSETVAALEAECQALREQIRERDTKLSELSGLGGVPVGGQEEMFGAPEPVADDALFGPPSVEPEPEPEGEPETPSEESPQEEPVSAPAVDSAELEDLRARLTDAQAVAAELRQRQEQEMVEARAAITSLQMANARIQEEHESAAGPDPTELAEAQQRVEELERALHQTREEHQQRQEQMEAQLADLGKQLGEAAQSGPSEEVQGRLSELEAELERARSEASPEELNSARQRISELEAALAAQQQAASDSNSEAHRHALEAELLRTREQLNEMAQELKRTLEGDRETKKLAYADQLTGLPNYNLTGQYLQVCFERSSRGEGALALILIDLDHFRRVNDALGQKAGDELLRQVGARLERSVKGKDTAIARRGEDEFMVVAFLEGATADSEQLSARIRGIAHNLLSELLKPFEVQGQKVQATASLGVAIFPGPAQNREELLEQSEHAMYKAKDSGRARVSFYTNDIHQTRVNRVRLERELRHAVNEGQFALLYQPIVEVPSGKIWGVEALLRWSHPTRGLLEPSHFLEVAEDTGIILPLGDLIIAEAFQVAKQKFMKRRFLTINLSHRQLIDSGFPERFMKQLGKTGVRPQDVLVEISEAATMMDPDRAKNTLSHLAHWGVGIALDDFGTGSSGISLLRELPIRLLKIDGSLVGRLPSDREAGKTCLAVTRLASALDIPVLAEGVESREQLEQVVGYGCKYAQGLFLREPVNVNHLIQIL